ncbi:MAG: hypothetical protein HQ541_12180, partial [Mariniphaga sp.]|nr:hypothetical protein [Mariniphaga sp.]
KKDLLCKRKDKTFVVGVYFPRIQQTYKAIEKKLLQDNAGVSKNYVDGLLFFTNQYLTIGERKKLATASGNKNTEIFHLERIALILNSPVGYGVRLEFLDIQLSKTEQLSYFALKDKELTSIQKKLSEILIAFNETGSFTNLSTEKISEFKETLETIVGDRNSIFVFGNSMIDRLHVPLTELQEFKKNLEYMTGDGFLWGNAPLDKLRVPLKDLEEYRDILYEIVGEDTFSATSPVNKLFVPLKDLEEYNMQLNETIEKLKEIEEIKRRTNIK